MNLAKRFQQITFNHGIRRSTRSSKTEDTLRIAFERPSCFHRHFHDGDTTVVRCFEHLRWIESRIFFGNNGDLTLSEADIDASDAFQASEVLLHPEGSKISGHSFDAEIDAIDCR